MLVTGGGSWFLLAPLAELGAKVDVSASLSDALDPSASWLDCAESKSLFLEARMLARVFWLDFCLVLAPSVLMRRGRLLLSHLSIYSRRKGCSFLTGPLCQTWLESWGERNQRGPWKARGAGGA